MLSVTQLAVVVSARTRIETRSLTVLILSVNGELNKRERVLLTQKVKMRSNGCIHRIYCACEAFKDNAECRSVPWFILITVPAKKQVSHKNEMF